MKKYFFIPLIAVVLFVGIIYSGNIKKALAPHSTKGILNLQEWDFSKNGNIPLNGEWEFYWNKTLLPDDFSKSEKPQPDTWVNVPAEWTSYSVEGKKLPNYGYATYRIVIKNGSLAEIGALKIRECGTAYNLFINGKLLAQQGVYGETKQKSTPAYKSQIIFFNPKKDENEIIINVSNFYHRAPGIWYEITLGNSNSVAKLREVKTGIEMLIVGALIIMGIYHIGLFWLRQKDKSGLYFGIFCFAIMFRSIVTGEEFLESNIITLDWELARKIEYVTFFLSVIFFSAFIKSLYPKQTRKWFYILTLVIAGGYTLITLLTGITFYSRILIGFQIFTVASFIMILLSLIRAFIQNEDGAGTIIIGFIFIIIGFINDTTASYSIIQSDFILPAAIFIFIFCQSFVLALKFAKAHKTAERLAKENMNMYNEIKELNSSLEDKVKLRTKELSETIEELKKTQNQLVISEKLATAGKLAGGIAHELNSPIGAVLTSAQYLKLEIREDLKEEGKRDEYVESLGIIEDAASKAKKIISKMLKYTQNSRSQTGIVDIKDGVATALEIFEKEFAEKKIKVITELENNLRINGEFSQIITLLENLISNAIKAVIQKSEDNRIIEITAYEDGGEKIVVEIKDSGNGIQQELIETIFDPHFASRNEGRGLGLGLNMCLDIVKRHNGEIRAESIPGESARFIIKFKK